MTGLPGITSDMNKSHAQIPALRAAVTDIWEGTPRASGDGSSSGKSKTSSYSRSPDDGRPRPWDGNRLNKYLVVTEDVTKTTRLFMALRLNENQAQNGRYRAYFLDPPTATSGLMAPASMAAAIICETIAVLLSGNLKRSRSV